MNRHICQLLLALMLTSISIAPAMAREGDTLEPITIDAPMLETSPENFLNGDDASTIEVRISEARNSGVPLAVRIIDMTQENSEIPFAVRSYADSDFSQPFTNEQKQEIGQAWADSEAIETSPGANDGFLLLVLVPEDRSQTQAIWWYGPNALPLNGLTAENIDATNTVMNEQFAAGNMPNGVFLGISEFSYNIQFGEPERIARTTLEDALHKAVIPLAIGTILAGLSVPILAFWLSRQNTQNTAAEIELSPWQAAALQLGRARQEIPAAMLLEHVHQGEISPTSDGGLLIDHDAKGSVVDALRPFTDAEGQVSKTAMYEIEAINVPVREDIEDSLAAAGAMTKFAKTDRTWILIAMGFATFLIVLGTVPTVMSMSAIGVFAIVTAVIGILAGWWWVSYRSYTTPAGKSLLASWLENANQEQRHLFDTVVHQSLLTDQDAGPDTSAQTDLVRKLRGLGAG